MREACNTERPFIRRICREQSPLHAGNIRRRECTNGESGGRGGRGHGDALVRAGRGSGRRAGEAGHEGGGRGKWSIAMGCVVCDARASLRKPGAGSANSIPGAERWGGWPHLRNAVQFESMMQNRPNPWDS